MPATDRPMASWRASEGQTTLFLDPIRELWVDATGVYLDGARQDRKPLDLMEELRADGTWVGYIGYEAASLWEDRPGSDGTYLQFVQWGRARKSKMPPPLGVKISELELGWTQEFHATQVERLLEAIRAGEFYQACLTFPARFRLEQGTAWDLHLLASEADPKPYSTYLRLGDLELVGQSPELFLRKRSDRIESWPMKGTRPPDGADELTADPKERAENVMITDLVRNDLGRVCQPGSVKVVGLAEVQKYRQVATTISRVAGDLVPETSWDDILAATFPAGSMTGAPKLRAMEALVDLESGPRGPYAGCYGIFEPNGDLELAVTIRTAVIRGQGGIIQIGGGIVADSKPESEWAEALLKARWLNPSRSH